jgi:hypothetical protein
MTMTAEEYLTLAQIAHSKKSYTTSKEAYAQMRRMNPTTSGTPTAPLFDASSDGREADDATTPIYNLPKQEGANTT